MDEGQPPKKKSGLMRWVLIAVIVIVVGGGGYFAYSQGYIPASILGTVKLDSLLDKMATTGTMTSGRFTMTINYSVGGRDKDATTFPLDDTATKTTSKVPFGVLPALAATDFTIFPITTDLESGIPTTLPGPAASSDAIYEQLANASGSVTIEGASSTADNATAGSARFTGSATVSNVTYAFDFEARVIKDQLYFMVSKIPSLPLFDTSKITNTWFQFDPSSLPLSVNPSALEQSSAKSKQLVEAFRDTLKETKAVVIEKTLGSETVDGIKAKRLRIAFKPDQLAAFYKGLMQRASKIDPQYAFDQSLMDEIAKPATQRQLEAYLKNATHEIVVDPKTGMLLGLKYTLRLVPPDSVKQLAGKQMNVTTEMTMRDVNKPVTVETPSPVKPMNDLTSLLFGGSLGGLAPSGAPDSVVPPASGSLDTSTADLEKDRDGDGLSDAFEQLFGTKVDVKDTDGDGFDDKTEIDSGHDPLKP